jgi:hypothetical protein
MVMMTRKTSLNPTQGSARQGQRHSRLARMADSLAALQPCLRYVEGRNAGWQRKCFNPDMNEEEADQVRLDPLS